MQKLNDAKVALLYAGIWITADGVLDSPAGREEIKKIFSEALAAAPSVTASPEYAVALGHFREANAAEAAEPHAGLLTVEESDVLPLEGN
jgi:hypothetical protein